MTVTDVFENTRPTITSNGGAATAAVAVAENTTAVTVVTAGDPDSGQTLTYAVTGGADQSRFTINPSTGALAFVTATNFEVPGDAGVDNVHDVHDVVVEASDAAGGVDTQAIAVTLTNVVENQTRVLTSGADIFTAPSDDNWNIEGGNGSDTITTAGGADIVFGGGSNDQISTGGGNDLIRFSGASGGYDTVDGGAGSDLLVTLAANTVIGLRSITGIEAISGGGFANVRVVGTSAAETFDFSALTITGIAAIEMGSGNDIVIGSAASDIINGQRGDDQLSGGGGDNVFRFSGGSQTRMTASTAAPGPIRSSRLPATWRSVFAR